MVTIKISNRAIYSILAIIILVLGGVAVYAVTLTPVPVGAIPNPGHSINEVVGPDNCLGKALSYTGTGWACLDFPTQYNSVTLTPRSIPVGTCVSGTLMVNSATGDLHFCKSGSWAKIA